MYQTLGYVEMYNFEKNIKNPNSDMEAIIFRLIDEYMNTRNTFPKTLDICPVASCPHGLFALQVGRANLFDSTLRYEKRLLALFCISDIL